VVMLEPRRLAARRAAEYMSSARNEKVGATIGYRIRGESRVGPSTRIEVVTEGILTRVLQSDPEIPEIGAIIFDEFHERSIHAELGLALAADVQANLRKDLRILVMSATIPSERLASMLDGAPVVAGEGKLFDVSTLYLDRPPTGTIEQTVSEGIGRALRVPDGDVLVFLPGAGEIRRVSSLLESRGMPEKVSVVQLYGDLPFDQQQRALGPLPGGGRKVILATSIAETSLTIDGVRIVVDSGLARSARFDPRRGMTGLVTGPVSVATADQRRGRAGRQGPGFCFRLWSEFQLTTLPAYPQPELSSADLAPFLLECACWGAPGGTGLRFLDPPPPAHVLQAGLLLRLLGAIDDTGRATRAGRELVQFPVHPRLAHMILRGKELGMGTLACDVAALLEFGDGLAKGIAAGIDLRSRLSALRGGQSDPGIWSRVEQEAVRLRGVAGIAGPDKAAGDAGVLLALAYPDRIARRRSSGEGKYLMANGTGAVLAPGTPLARNEFLAVGDVDGQAIDARIFLASPIEKQQIREIFREEIGTSEEIYWDGAHECVVARRAEKLGDVILDEKPIPTSDERVASAMATGVTELGLGVLPWSEAADELRMRSEWLRTSGLVPLEWPDLSDGTLAGNTTVWLAPFLPGISRKSQLNRLDMVQIVESFFRRDQRLLLDRLAPPSFRAPTGSNIRLVYAPGSAPILRVRLQEMFGQVDTPRIGDGSVSVLVHLLSPAQRPLAVTQDLRNFWASVYPEVRKEMRGRYPKHVWPEDPLSAMPTRRTKKRSGNS